MTKNIQILPAQNNNTKLAVYHYDSSKNIKIGELGLQLNNEIGWSSYWSPRELYITSDEEIKEGDWLIVNNEDVMQMKSSYDNDMSGEDIWVGDSLNGHVTYKDNCKKIILTTDQDLIKDGVQAIDDEFLEWFVKNPSCEFVKTDSYKTIYHTWLHKIIIPKEEPKQETLEEAAERLWLDSTSQLTSKKSFIAGAKWQQKRMYSEEEVYKLLSTIPNFFNMTISQQIKSREEWFEQFKKK